MIRAGLVVVGALAMSGSFASLGCRAAAPPPAFSPPPSSLGSLRVVARATGLDRTKISKPFELTTAHGTVVLYDAASGPTDSRPCIHSLKTRAPEAFEERCLDLIGDGETPIHGWAHAQVLADRTTIVALLESKVEGPGESLDVVVSRDAGGSWQRRGSVRKPHYMAEFRSLEAASGAHKAWKLSIDLEDCADCGVAQGVYYYESSDEGLTWKAGRR